MIFEKAKSNFQLCRGELGSEGTEDVFTIVNAAAEPAELTFECIAAEHRLVSASFRSKGGSGIKLHFGQRADGARSEPDRRDVTFTDGPHAHYETNIARRNPCLVGVQHHAWVAKCGTLDGIFTRKGGAKEEPAGWGQLALGVQPIRELVGMLKEYFRQVVMSSIESKQHIIKTVLCLFV